MERTVITEDDKQLCLNLDEQVKKLAFCYVFLLKISLSVLVTVSWLSLV